MPPAPAQYENASAIVVALVALVVIMLLCRWTFSTGDRDQRTARRLDRLRSRGDFGLLVPVATVRTPEDADLLREVLRVAGIRGTVADTESPPDRVVLVFRADAERARSLVQTR